VAEDRERLAVRLPGCLVAQVAGHPVPELLARLDQLEVREPEAHLAARRGLRVPLEE